MQKAGELPLLGTLDRALDTARKDISSISKLKGANRVKALQKLEVDIRLIGSMIETQSLNQDGYKNMFDFMKSYQKRFSYTMDRALRIELLAVSDILKNDLGQMRDGCLLEDFDVKILSKSARRKYLALETKQQEVQKLLAIPDDSLIGRRFSIFLDTLDEDSLLSGRYKWIKNEGYYQALREIYLVTLCQIRSFGEEQIHIKPHSLRLKNKKSEQLIIEKIIALPPFPTDWIKASNQYNSLFIIRSYEQVWRQQVADEKENPIPTAYSHKCLEHDTYSLEHYACTLFSRQRHSAIYIYDDNLGESIFVHEMGHRFVYMRPFIGDLQETFFLRRTTTKDGKRRNLLGPGSDFREGDFQEPYTGMDPYRVRTRAMKEWYEKNPGKEPLSDWPKEECKLGYEVFSTGLEQVLSGNYGSLDPNSRDDELRHFILGILATV